MTNREQQLAEAFVGLADTLADDFDPVVLLHRLAGHCVDILGADVVGVMVATLRGDLRTMAVSDERAAVVDLFRPQTTEGPCLDCYRAGRPVDVPDLAGTGARWPRVVPLAVRAGLRSAQALPLRVNHRTIGAVGLFHAAPGGLLPADLKLAQALADVAAVALIHWTPERARPSDVLTHVQSAIAAQAAVETATGMLAEYGRLHPTDARRALHAYSHHDGDSPAHIAHALIRRTLAPQTVLAGWSGRGAR